MNLISNTLLKGRVICLFFVAAFVACNDPIKEHKLAGNALGTTYHITYLGTEIDSLEAKIDSMLFAVNHALSTYQQNSLITAFNTNSNDMWDDPENAKHFLNDMQHFVEMVHLSKSISTKTKGAFDPSAAALYQLYDNAKKTNQLMDSTQVQAALSHVGMNKITFDPNGFPLKEDSLVTLNFNAIAKGYFVDIICTYLDSKNCKNYLVEVGGETKVKGQNIDGESWKLGINVPVIEANPQDYFKVMELENVAMATSGNYQNYYTVNNKVIGHTLDPRTGKAIISNLKSVSVLHLDCGVADAYATACMVLGLEDSKELIQSDSSLSAYFIYEEDDELKGLFVE